jgi:hypothetical protein
MLPAWAFDGQRSVVVVHVRCSVGCGSSGAKRPIVGEERTPGRNLAEEYGSNCLLTRPIEKGGRRTWRSSHQTGALAIGVKE